MESTDPSKLIIIPKAPNIMYSEQSINHVLMLKGFIHTIPPLYESLIGARSELLATIRDICRPENINPVIKLIKEVLNEDVKYEKTPLDLRNQRTYAVKVGKYVCIASNF